MAGGLACFTVLVVAPLNSGVSQSPPQVNGYPPLDPMVANRPPDPNRVLEDSMRVQENQKRIAEYNLQRQKAMTEDTVKLLALANELKTETNRIDKDTLSVSALKAEEIARLAHRVREMMESKISK